MTAADRPEARILVVDDDPAELVLLQRMLASAGHLAVTGTRDPRQVRALVGEIPFDLILLDLEMPEMSGFDVLAELRGGSGDDLVPVVVITAEPRHKLRALQAGARAFVSKPFELPEVLSHVRNMLEVRFANRHAREHALRLELSVREAEATGVLMRRQAEEVAFLYEQVVVEQRLSECLMLHVLPSSAAGRLRGHPQVEADSHPDVTLVLCDIVGFNLLPRRPDGGAVRAILTHLFEEFDKLARGLGMETVWTPGDAYLAASGMATPGDGHHADRAADLAFAVLDLMVDFRATTGLPLAARLGLSSGPVTGSRGGRAFIYDLWDDTVQVAAALEARGEPGRAVLAESTRLLLGPGFRGEPRAIAPARPAAQAASWFLVRSLARADAGCRTFPDVRPVR